MNDVVLLEEHKNFRKVGYYIEDENKIDISVQHHDGDNWVEKERFRVSPRDIRLLAEFCGFDINKECCSKEQIAVIAKKGNQKVVGGCNCVSK